MVRGLIYSRKPETDVDTCLSPDAVAAPAKELPRSEYRIVAVSTPQVMLRILGLFAQQDRVPERVRMDVVEDMIWLALSVDGLTRHRAEIIAEKLRALIDTVTVDLA